MPAPSTTNVISTSQVVYSASASDETMMTARSELFPSDSNYKDNMILNPSYFDTNICLFSCLNIFKVSSIYVNTARTVMIFPFPICNTFPIFKEM